MWGLAAAVFLAAGGMLQGTLDEQSEQYQLNPPEIVENHPAKVLLTMTPGGLRAPIVTYLWIRAENLKSDGRLYEAMQLADFICKLQPNFAGVWGFHSWNMAWNISVKTHTPQERWLWVYNGVKLLRDEGIPQNRKEVGLYMDLGWIYFMKMGLTMDEMHMVYKRRWAALMQHLLGAPPQGTTKETIDAFRPIAQAPLDKEPRRQGQQVIQEDQLALVLADTSVAEYTELLKAQGVEIDQQFLDVYNRYTRDEEVEVTRHPINRFRPASEREKAISAIINATEHTEARRKILTFIRAQVLWNVYKMDPQWMLGLMEKYGPLDWRLVQPHGMYWTSYGLNICDKLEMDEIDSLNTGRTVINSLKAMSWIGKLTYIENPDDPEMPYLTMGPDWQFFKFTHEEFVRTGHKVSRSRGREFKENSFRSGHINYLSRAIQTLYAGYRRKEAREYFEWVKENYELEGNEWALELEDFIIARFAAEGAPVAFTAHSQISIALQMGLLQRELGSQDGYRKSINYARRIYNAYQKEVPTRVKLPPFGIMIRDTAAQMIVEPRTIGINMDLMARASLYAKL
ncbi:MAG: hypothetical protein ACYSTL_01015, partial [Planctomycetota bacterium]